MNKAAFLDRDGIINIDHGYVVKPEQFDFVPGIFELCTKLQQLDYQLVVVTNQSGIARGYYSEADFLALTKWMTGQFAEQGVQINGVYFCPHHPTHGQPPYLKSCECRKPEPGMLFKAADELTLDLATSLMIGDKLSDMQAAEAAGVPQRYLVSSKYSRDENVSDGVQVVDDLQGIIERIG